MQLSAFPLWGKAEEKVKDMAVYFAVSFLGSSSLFSFFCLEVALVNGM